MKAFRNSLIIFATILAISGAGFFVLNFFHPKPSGIYISTSPRSNVYINGSFIGKTPLEKTFDASTIDLKLVPEITDQELFPFETKLTLASGIETIVRREFGNSDESSSGDIISFEKDGGGAASLVVISTPDNAEISVDGIPRGFSPYKIASIQQGSHKITVKMDGYSDRIMTISAKEGYRLNLFAKLSKSENEINSSPSPTPISQSTKVVVVLSTPTGYLRVRTEPGTKGEEIGQVKPGDKFSYLDTDADTGWFKIQFEEPQPGLPNGITGWISNQYAKIVDKSENVATSSATPISVQY